jgi:hypothetical protein
MNEPPIQVESGASGAQVAGPIDQLSIDATPPTHGLHIARVLEGLVVTHPRSFGGEVTANLLYASFAQLSHDLETTRNNLKIRDEQLQKLQDELACKKTTIAVLRERLGNIEFNQIIKQIATFTGTACLGLAADLYKNNLDHISYFIGGIGIILLLASLLTKRGEGNE